MSSDHDKTLRPDAVTRGVRSAAELAAELSMSAHALPAGTKLQDFVITGLLGEGGFGIVYLAEDAALQREVALKEYLPSSMASRAKDAATVMVRSHSHQETFDLGLKSFVNEARLLARFDHPALVKVHRFWEANGTAYMVMPYYRGPTLKAVLRDLGHLPGEAELRRWLWPLMDALEVMHAAQCFHRDIAPDNILITGNGPLLLDFGAARHVIADMTQALTVVLKPGFAPIEQYGEIPGMTQGAWTDIYALASVLYAAIAGKRPMPSVERLITDQLQPLAMVAAGRYPAPFLQAIDQALAVRPDQRPQSVRAFRELLERRPAANAGRVADPHTDAFEQTLLAPPPRAPAARPAALAAPAAIAAPTAAPSPAPSPAPDPVAGAAATSKSGLVMASVGIGVVALAAVGYLALGRGGEVSTVANTAASAPAATALTPAVVVPVAAPVAPPATPPATPTVTAAPPEAVASAASSAVAAVPSRPTPASTPAPAPTTAAPAPAGAVPVAVPIAQKPPRPAVTLQAPARADDGYGAGYGDRPAPAGKSAELRAKCSDTLQKATLETLSASEQAFLRKECR